MWLYSPVCVGPGRKPLRPGFSQRGSHGSQPKVNVWFFADLKQGVQRKWSFFSDFFFFVFFFFFLFLFQSILLCFAVDICDLVHDVEAIHILFAVSWASLIFQKRFPDADSS